VSRHGHAFIDRALYLPKEWTDDPERMTAAHVPDDVHSSANTVLATSQTVERAADSLRGSVDGFLHQVAV
jgi:SRSO17 transposase